MKPLQHEIPVVGDRFNLAGQVADDPWRVDRERWEAAERLAAGREYAARMQRTFEQCPGFVGGDAPTSETGRGVVVVEPGHIIEALAWLKRRFHASETIDISTELQRIAIEIAPRVRRSPSGGRKIRISFDKPVQFEFKI